MVLGVMAVLAAVFTGGYMAPWAVAVVRNTTSQWGVFWINLLLGWTIVGWVIALVMSLMAERRYNQ